MSHAEESPQIIHVQTSVHGRVLVRHPTAAQATAPLQLVVCHGYGEDAAAALAAAERFPGVDVWRLVAPQALSRFYTKTGDVVASWMTRQDRELTIADNVGYLGGVLAELERTHGRPQRLVFAGFSQGTAMAWRGAVHAGHPVDAVLMLGGDIPPDVVADLPPGLRVLVGRGDADTWYSADKLAADRAVLDRAGAQVTVCEFAGGHEWGEPFIVAAGRLLAELAQTAVNRAG